MKYPDPVSHPDFFSWFESIKVDHPSLEEKNDGGPHMKDAQLVAGAHRHLVLGSKEKFPPAAECPVGPYIAV